MCSSELGSFFLDPRDIQEDAAVRAAAPLADFLDDLARDVIAGEQLGRAARVAIAGNVAPALFLAVGGLGLVELRDVVEHEAAALAVEQNSALAAHAFGHQDSGDAGRPHHPGRMKLHEFHVHQLRSGAIGERLPVAGVLPAVGGDLVGTADSAGGYHHRLGLPAMKDAALAIVAERADDAAAVGRAARPPPSP